MNTMEQAQIPKLLTLAEVSDTLRVTYWRVAELARKGAIPGVVRIGRHVRVRQDALAEFIRSGGYRLPGGWRRRPPEQAEAAR
jgi:excisionase family DNA binding protein